MRLSTLPSLLLFSGVAAGIACSPAASAQDAAQQTLALPFCMFEKLSAIDLVPAIQDLKSPPTLTATSNGEGVSCPDGFHAMRMTMSYGPADYATKDEAQAAMAQAKRRLEATRPAVRKTAPASDAN